jgi:hypothetical protein
LIALWLQPLAQTFMAYKYGQGYKKQLLIATMVYFVMVIYAITQALDKNATFTAQPQVGCSHSDSTCSMDGTPCKFGHLLWKRSNSKAFLGPDPSAQLYMFGLFFGLFFMKPKLFGIMLTVLGGIMVIYSAKENGRYQMSSMWCLYAIFYAFLAVMMAYSRRNV